MEKKIQKSFIDEGFGFKVRLINVPMVKIRDAWTPNINYNELAKAVLLALCHKPARLTGAEVRFVRQQMDMTLQAFADRFCVSHVAVIKWEKAGSKPTPMAWTTEKDMRLFILSKFFPKPIELAKLYAGLERERAEKGPSVEIDANKMAA
jgi:hypothetical protein